MITLAGDGNTLDLNVNVLPADPAERIALVAKRIEEEREHVKAADVTFMDQYSFVQTPADPVVRVLEGIRRTKA